MQPDPSKKTPRTALTGRLGIAHPIIQAPLASISTAPMVAAVAGAGALGSLGAANMTPRAVAEQLRAVRALTAAPFAVNFFVHQPPREDEETARRMRDRLEVYRVELGADPFPPLAPQSQPFGAEMLEVVLAARPPVVSFHFGVPEPPVMRALKSAGIAVLSSATTVEEARLLEAAGVDAVIAQGIEAGGHRGTFASPFSDGQLGTMALVPQVARAVRVPVIAAGGIANGQGIAAALLLGAAAAQLGTAFLGCPEAAIDPGYRATLFEPRAARTRVTTLLSGRPARAIVTRLLDELADLEGKTPAFPLQRVLSGHLARAGLQRGNVEFHAMWAGQSAPLLRNLGAAELIATLVAETEAAV